MVIVDDPLPGAAIEAGLKPTVVPAGAPVALSETALLKPPETVVVIVDGPAVPCTRVTEVGDAAIVKFGVGAPAKLLTKAVASTVPTPVTASYPVPQLKPVTPGTLLLPLVTSWNITVPPLAYCALASG